MYEERDETALWPKKQTYAAREATQAPNLSRNQSSSNCPTASPLLSRAAPTSEPVTACRRLYGWLTKRLQPPLQISPQHHFSPAFKVLLVRGGPSHPDGPITALTALPLDLMQTMPVSVASNYRRSALECRCATWIAFSATRFSRPAGFICLLQPCLASPMSKKLGPLRHLSLLSYFLPRDPSRLHS
jgi:hypothetical protein